MMAALLVAAVLAQVAAAPSDVGPPDAELAAAVRRLVRQLDAGELRLRTEAEAKLVELGPAALAALPAPDDRMPAEVVQRLSRVRQALQRLQAEQAAEASRVTLHSEGMPLSQVLAEISKQTGNKFDDQRRVFGHVDEDPKVKVDFDGTPFWPAVDRVFDQAQLTAYLPSRDGLAIIGRPDNEVPRTQRGNYQGPFRFEVSRLTAQRLPSIVAPGRLTITLEVAWEPRLQPIALIQPSAQLEAVDDERRTVEPLDADSVWEAAPAGGSGVELTLPFHLPARTAKSLARLRGEMTVLAPGPVHAFEFDNLAEARNVEKRHDAAVVTFEGARKNNDVWEVRVRVRFDDPQGGLQSHRTWVYGNQAYLVGDDGMPITHDGAHTTLRSDEEAGVAYIFDLPQGLDGLKLIYKTPTAIHRLPVKWEVNDLELP